MEGVMSYENNNRGVLFPVKDEDKKHEKSPDFTGNVTVEGVFKYVSGWKQVSRDGTKKYISLALNDPKTDQNEPKKEHFADNQESDDEPW
jgi:uncharacterized protein (DUF736 family)